MTTDAYQPATLRTIAYHFTLDTPASDPTQEIRVGPSIGRPFVIHSLDVVPHSPGVPGQFFDVRAVSDPDPSDNARNAGTSLLNYLSDPAAPPAPDGNIGLPIPRETLSLGPIATEQPGGTAIKVVTYYLAPAATLPSVTIIITVLELLTYQPIRDLRRIPTPRLPELLPVTEPTPAEPTPTTPENAPIPEPPPIPQPTPPADLPIPAPPRPLIGEPLTQPAYSQRERPNTTDA